jgi:DNA-binding NtrC family response regulator
MSIDHTAQRLILLVENDEDSCSALTKLLERHGYVVKCATTVADALAQLVFNPTHVISGPDVAGRNGLIVLQYIRATTPWMKVAILSGWSDCCPRVLRSLTWSSKARATLSD